MSDEKKPTKILVVDDDSHRVRSLLAAVVGMCPEVLELLPEPEPPRIYTHADEERQAKAEAKRQRKAAKRAARKETT